jgi:cytochrome bd-type quinol oxidase subunit 2
VPVFKLLVILVLIAIVVSLGSALFHLAHGSGDSHKVVRALSWRIGLSVALFVLLLLAFRVGLITPHGLGQ